MPIELICKDYYCENCGATSHDEDDCPICPYCKERESRQGLGYCCFCDGCGECHNLDDVFDCEEGCGREHPHY